MYYFYCRRNVRPTRVKIFIICLSYRIETGVLHTYNNNGRRFWVKSNLRNGGKVKRGRYIKIRQSHLLVDTTNTLYLKLFFHSPFYYYLRIRVLIKNAFTQNDSRHSLNPDHFAQYNMGVDRSCV